VCKIHARSYHGLPCTCSKRVFFFVFEIMILLLCKMPGIKSIVFFFIPSACPANKSNVSGVTDHLDNPSFEVDENGETKPVIFLAYFV